MALRRRLHRGASRDTASATIFLTVMALQLVTCCDGFIPSRLLGGAAMSWPPAPSRGRGIRGCSRQATCSSSSRRAPPRRFSNGCANGLCSSGNRSSWAASSNRLCGKRSNGGDDTSIGSSRVNGDSDGDGILSITTFNVLAPIFKRVGTGRESEFREAYLARHASIISHLKSVGSDVICLQELWVAEQEMVDMYQRSLQGYSMFTLPRTEARGDGVACFVKEDIDVLDKQAYYTLFDVENLRVGFACTGKGCSGGSWHGTGGFMEIEEPTSWRSYASTISIVACLLSAGYIVFAYASPAYHRRKSRRDYQIIAGGAPITTAPHEGAGSRAAPANEVGTSQAQPGGAMGASVQAQGAQGGSADGVLGRGWRAYGSTDEAPAGAGCLPPSTR